MSSKRAIRRRKLRALKAVPHDYSRPAPAFDLDTAAEDWGAEHGWECSCRWCEHYLYDSYIEDPWCDVGCDECDTDSDYMHHHWHSAIGGPNRDDVMAQCVSCQRYHPVFGNTWVSEGKLMTQACEHYIVNGYEDGLEQTRICAGALFLVTDPEIRDAVLAMFLLGGWEALCT